MESLSGETFLAGVEMIQQQLRIKREDHWSQAVCKLKFVSFKSEFPEVNDSQFCWACEQWIQQHSNQDYVTFPLWRELMTPLYAVENGQANRSWGFKRDLPPAIAPSAEQKALLPPTARSIAGAADPQNRDAYDSFRAPSSHLLPAITAATGDGLTKEEWARYLRELAQEVSGKPD